MPDSIKLAVEGAPLPPTFVGTPQEFYEAMLDRMRVIFPTGQTSFVISDTEPSTNQGPWLKNGTQWFTWNDTDKRYVPLDTSPSWPIQISSTAPVSGATYPIWIQFIGTRAVQIYLWLASAWKPIGVNRGNTAGRPTDATDYERYWDTDIGSEIYWHGGTWRTVSGSPGDVKFVTFGTLEEALAKNPGWQEIGGNFADDSIRGRALVPAHKNSGVSPTTSLPAGAGQTVRFASQKFGSETHTLTIPEMPSHTHTFKRWFSGAGTDGTDPLDGTNVDGGYFVEPTSSTGGDQPHDNIQPSLALWCLVKLG